MTQKDMETTWKWKRTQTWTICGIGEFCSFGLWPFIWALPLIRAPPLIRALAAHLGSAAHSGSCCSFGLCRSFRLSLLIRALPLIWALPLIRALSGARKVFLAPLSRYWIDPCCWEPDHLSNYKTAGYLRSLGAATNVLKEFISDSLYTRHTSNFRVLCPNKILGIGQIHAEQAIKDARELAALWGRDLVHPSGAAYKVIADGLSKDILNSEARYTNPPSL
jgi:hypothetical protein